MSKFALPSRGKYPLDTLSDITKAESYFLEHERDFPLELRREFCTKLAEEKKAYKLKMHEKIAAYAGSQLDKVKVNGTILSRKTIADQMPLEVDTKPLEKIAEMTDIEEAIKALTEFDKKLGLDRLWDSRISNPIVALTKEAEFDVSGQSSPPGLIELNGERASEDQLIRLSLNWERLNGLLTDDFIQSFKKAPLNAYGKLTENEKVLVLRMASQLDATAGYYH